MSLFGALKNLGAAAIEVAKVPVSLALDSVTLGHTMSQGDEPYTVTNAKKIAKKTGKAVEELYEDDDDE